MSEDLWSSFASDVFADLPSYAPPPLELFEEMLLEIENLDVDIQFPTLPDISSPTPLPASPESAYSMPGLTRDISNTEYSTMSVTTSNYLPLFDPARRDVVLGSEYNNVDPKHNPVISDSSMFPPELPFQYDDVVIAQPDDGPDRQLVGISPHCLDSSTAIQSPPPAVPIDPPADTASNTNVFTGPIRTKSTCNQCDQCGRVFDRKSNLKSHIETHDPNRKRPFVCPESDCSYPLGFTRSHDLKRHLKKHGGGAK